MGCGASAELQKKGTGWLVPGGWCPSCALRAGCVPSSWSSIVVFTLKLCL